MGTEEAGRGDVGEVEGPGTVREPVGAEDDQSGEVAAV